MPVRKPPRSLSTPETSLTLLSLSEFMNMPGAFLWRNSIYATTQNFGNIIFVLCLLSNVSQNLQMELICSKKKGKDIPVTGHGDP
jgi:hypothetical protein